MLKAIVEILKKHPNIVQKEVVERLEREYGVKSITQTSVSRYIRKIYAMKKHVDVLLQAKR